MLKIKTQTHIQKAFRRELIKWSLRRNKCILLFCASRCEQHTTYRYITSSGFKGLLDLLKNICTNWSSFCSKLFWSLFIPDVLLKLLEVTKSPLFIPAKSLGCCPRRKVRVFSLAQPFKIMRTLTCLEPMLMINLSLFLKIIHFIFGILPASHVMVSAPPMDAGFRETCTYLPHILPKRDIQNLILFLSIWEWLPPAWGVAILLLWCSSYIFDSGTKQIKPVNPCLLTRAVQGGWSPELLKCQLWREMCAVMGISCYDTSMDISFVLSATASWPRKAVVVQVS